MIYMHKFVYQAVHSGGLPENLTLPEAKFRANLQFRKISTTDTEGVYMACKFDFDILKDCGDIAPRNFAKKWKWNQLWEFPKILIR